MKSLYRLISPLISLSILFYACSEERNCEGDLKVSIVQDGTNVLRGVASGGTPPYYYSWSNAVRGLSEITVTAPGNYRVEVTDLEGCTATNGYNFIINTSNACGPDTTVSDNEGNVYRIVGIGNQCWMAVNLKISAGIPEETNINTWGSLTTPAWCYYDNDVSNSNFYGKLYNWYAVNTGNLCPNGWHIPTDADWQTLVDFLGGDSIAGGSMKNIALWNPPNTDATNNSGFSALPGGVRNLNGEFVNMGNSGVFWASTEVNTDQASGRELVYNNASVNSFNSLKVRGYSCRCVKD